MARLVHRWHRDQPHPKGCAGCARAGFNAKNAAMGDGTDAATSTYTMNGVEHTVTVTRPAYEDR